MVETPSLVWADYAKWDHLEVNGPEDAATAAARKEERDREMARACTGCRNLDRSEERRVFELPASAKLERCEVFCGRGVLLFQEGVYYRAVQAFQKCLAYYEYAFPDDDETQARLDRARLGALLGAAACSLEVRLYHDAAGHCDQALKADPRNVAALGYRAAARRELDLYDEARADVEAALAIDAADPRAAREGRLLAAKERAYAANSRRQAKRVVAGLGDGAAAAAGADAPPPPPGGAPPPSRALEAARKARLARAADRVLPAALPRCLRDGLDDTSRPLDAGAPALLALASALAGDDAADRALVEAAAP